MTAPTSKKCSDKDCECGGVEQPIENFYKARSGKYGRMARCKISFKNYLKRREDKTEEKPQETFQPIDIVLITDTQNFEHSYVTYIVSDKFLIINDFTENSRHFYPLNTVKKFIESPSRNDT